MNLKQLSGFIAGPGGILLLMFFFLPWISVSCSAPGLGNSTIMEGTGFDLAQGLDEDNLSDDYANSFGFSEDMFDDIDTGGEDFDFEVTAPEPEFGDEEASFQKSAPYLYVIPLVALIVIGVALYGFFNPSILNMYTGLVAYVLPSLVGGGVMLLKFMALRDDQAILDKESAASAAEQGSEAVAAVLKLHYEAGWWLTFFALAVIFAAGAVLFLAVDDKSEGSNKVAARPATAGKSASIKPPSTPEEIKAAFTQAKLHIQAKEYDKARAILNIIDHPTAKAWLAKVDELDPFGVIPD